MFRTNISVRDLRALLARERRSTIVSSATTVEGIARAWLGGVAGERNIGLDALELIAARRDRSAEALRLELVAMSASERAAFFASLGDEPSVALARAILAQRFEGDSLDLDELGVEIFPLLASASALFPLASAPGIALTSPVASDAAALFSAALPEIEVAVVAVDAPAPIPPPHIEIVREAGCVVAKFSESDLRERRDEVIAALLALLRS